MKEGTTPDFSGYATKAGLKCADGRIIMPEAFQHQDKSIVPLVWQHNHNEPSNVLGHALLEHRNDGTYAYAFFNESSQAKNAKLLVEHGDITSLSIYANQLIERGKQVFHGVIRELSLVLSGANPGALIDNITIVHSSDGEVVTLEDEAVIYTGLELRHSDDGENDDSDADDDSDKSNDDESDDDKNDDDESDDDKSDNDESDSDKSADDDDSESDEDAKVEHSIGDVYTSMTAEQKNVVHLIVGAAIENTNTSDDDEDSSDISHNNDSEKEGRRMTRNVFDQTSGGSTKEKEKHALSHDAVKGIVEEAKRIGSLKAAIEGYALQHGIENIELLFPDARTVTDTPEFDARRVEWVAGVLNGTKHSPFSRIRTFSANLTLEEARAKGYVKGNLKKEEFFAVSRRSTSPSTVYKKQGLDRDDIVDIVDFDVVIWLKAEMRLMLDEEIARAVLIGDGRDVEDDDKIKDPAGASEGAGIRSILNDHDLYSATITVDDSAASTDVVDAIISSMGYYKGSGTPAFYTTRPVLTSLLLTRDEFGHRLWRTPSDLAQEMGVSDIVPVEVMEDESDVIGIIVNLRDYTLGTDKGGEVNTFDDFDIDYNKYKYLMETRLSGALTKIRSALVIRRASSGGTLATPVRPAFDSDSSEVTVATTTGVIYKNSDTDATLTTGSPVSLDPGEVLNVKATPDTGYYFSDNQHDEWTFTGVTTS